MHSLHERSHRALHLAAILLLGLAPVAAVAGECPSGQSVTVDTDGHCCWPAQAWSRTRSICVGPPQCPSGFDPAPGDRCVGRAPVCPPGQAITVDTDGYCCWPDQVFSKTRGACVGTPRCPSGFQASGDSCVAAAAAPSCPAGQAVTSDTAGHCCWPLQVWSSSRGRCLGVPRCPTGMAADGDDCHPAAAPIEGAPPPPPPAADDDMFNAPSRPAPRRTPSAPTDERSAEPAGAHAPSPTTQGGWISIHPQLSLSFEGFFFQVAGTQVTVGSTTISNGGAVGGGGGFAARGGIVNPFPFSAGSLRFAVHAGLGLGLAGALDSPAGAKKVYFVFYLQVPLYLGAELRLGESVTLSLDWQPTIVVVAAGGHDGEAMNPLGIAVGAELGTRKKRHLRLGAWILPAVVGMPFSAGLSIGAAIL